METSPDLPEAKIDPEGRFKYIQITVTTKTGEKRTYVRGYRALAYHMEIFEHFVSNELPKLEGNQGASCPGGGRIEHFPGEKRLSIYGYSQSYGLADHAVTKEILQRAYPDYTITWSNEGY